MLVPEEAPHRQTLRDLLSVFSETPIVDLAPQAARLFELLAGFPNSTRLAFQLGAQVPFTAYAPLAIPMKFAPTVSEAIQFLCRFVHLQAPLVNPQFTKTEDGAQVILSVNEPLSTRAEDFVIIAGFVSLSTEIASITHNKCNFSRLELRNVTDDTAALFQNMLGITPHAGNEANKVWIDQDILDAPNPFADPLTFKRHVEQFEAAERDRSVNQSMAKTVERKIAASIDAPPSFKDLAAQLRMTERQLRFALAKEDTNYRELLQQARVEFARAQLANPRVSISNLAHRLGYADVTAFNHGFKRWTGMSPSQFQQHMKDDSAQ